MRLWLIILRNIQTAKKIIRLLPTEKKEEEIMIDESKWSEDDFDLRLYNSMDDEGKRAWRKIFGLPKLLKEGNPPADVNEDAEMET